MVRLDGRQMGNVVDIAMAVTDVFREEGLSGMEHTSEPMVDTERGDGSELWVGW